MSSYKPSAKKKYLRGEIDREFFEDFNEHIEEGIEELSDEYNRSISIVRYIFIPPQRFQDYAYKNCDGRKVFPKIELLTSLSNIGMFELGFKRNITSHKFEPFFGRYSKSSGSGWIPKKYDRDPLVRLEAILKNHTEREKNKRIVKNNVDKLGDEELAELADRVEST